MSRKFSQKFQDFFNVVILKGEVLGKVSHYFYKKEYQARVAPHYHILLWIEDAPVAGVDDDEVVLQWIQERITCRIPEPTTNPELHQLVTKYLYHKCNKYCQRRKQVKGTFITRCRFSFPRQECEKATLLTVEECMKQHQKKCTNFHGQLRRSGLTTILFSSCCGRQTLTCSWLASPPWLLPSMSLAT